MQHFNLASYLERFRDPNEEYPLLFETVAKVLPDTNASYGPWLAGGSVRRLLDGSKEAGDFDVFFRGEKQLTDFRCALHNIDDNLLKVLGETENENNITLKCQVCFDFSFREIQIQLIKFYFEGLKDLSAWFDYTICQAVVTEDDGELNIHLGDFTAFDIARKRLAVNNIHHAVSSVRRLIKYTKQGYIACRGTIADILNRVVDNPDIINEEFEYLD